MPTASAERIQQLKLLFKQEQEQLLLNGASELENRIFARIMDDFISKLTLSNGKIVSNGKAISLSNSVDMIFNRFEQTEQLKEANKIIKAFTGTSSFNHQQYALFETDGKRYAEIRKDVDGFMLKTIGVDSDGTVITNGLLDNFIHNKDLRKEVKDIVFSGVVSGAKVKDVVDRLSLKLTGSSQDDVDGGITRYYKGFVFDQYQKYDRRHNLLMAKKLGLIDFIYEGGLIGESRDFCIERNNKTFTLEEAEQWVNDPKLPRTKAEKESGTTDYDPLIDMGRWNCRHIPRFISPEAAARKREKQPKPELSNEAIRIAKAEEMAKQFGNIPLIQNELNAAALAPKVRIAVKKLGDTFHLAVYKYTGEDHDKINTYLRTGKIKTVEDNNYEAEKEDLITLTARIDEAIDVAPKFAGLSYRGIKFEPFKQKDFESLLKEFKVGGLYIEKGYLSSSYKKESAYSKSAGANKNTNYITFEIIGKNGVVIKDVSKYESEHEILFKRGTKFSVVEVTKVTYNVTHVKLIEL